MREPEGGEDALAQIRTRADLVRGLDGLRRRAAVGTGRSRISLDSIARKTGIPRSTVHSYLCGVRLPPPDALDAVVLALGAGPAEQRSWAEALNRAREPVPVPNASVPHLLPSRPHGFIGRTEERGALDQMLGDGVPIVRLSGMAGVGKTAVALDWAHRRARDFPDGQLWVDLRGFGPRPPLRPADVLDRWLRALGVTAAALPMDLDARSDLLRSSLATRRMLLVLDNARDAEQVRPLLPGWGECFSVVTSRAELRSLAIVEGAGCVAVKPLSPGRAVELLRANPDGHDEDSLAELAAHCAGLPLALRIVRERMSGATPHQVAEFAAELGADRANRLAAFDLNDGADTVSVGAALSWSFSALPAAASTLLCLLPLCHTPMIELEPATALTGDGRSATRQSLDMLAAASLLEAAGPDRYQVHDLVSTFAERTQSDLDPLELDAARARLIDHYLNLADAAAARVRPSPPPTLSCPAHTEQFASEAAASTWLLARTETLVAVASEAMQTGRVRAGCTLVDRIARVALFSGDLESVLEGLRAGRDAASAVGDRLAESIMGQLLGIGYAHRGDLRAAAEAMTRAVDAAVASGDEVSVAKNRTNLAAVHTMAGALSLARTELRAVVDQLQAAPGLRPVYVTLATIEHAAGDGPARDFWLGRAWDECGRVPDVSHMHLIMLSAHTAHERGADAERDTLITQAENLAVGGVHPELTSRILTLRSQLALRRGDTTEARQLALDAMLHAGRTRGQEVTIQAGRALAFATVDDDPHDAIALAEEACALARTTGLRYEEAVSLVALARLHYDLDRPTQARRCAQTALKVAEAHGFRRVIDDARQLLLAIERTTAA